MGMGFREGYEYFQKSSGAALAAFQGGDFGAGRAAYVGAVEDEISALEKSINAFFGDHTPAKQLKGDIAEFWHAGTFNVTILFALEFEEFKQDITVRCNPMMSGSRQMTIEDYMEQNGDYSKTFQRQSDVQSSIY